MTNLWCHHHAFPGSWVPGNGFDRVLPSAFRNVTDLSALIARAASRGSIEKLGLLVHGDEGVLKTGATGDNLVTPERIVADSLLRAKLTDIRDYLRGNAVVSFYSCSAGASERGSRLLVELSRIWPGRTVIGSITKGYRFGTLTAADFRDTLLTVIEQLPGTNHFYVPGQSTRAGRGVFFLPPTLPKFLAVASTIKKARNGAIIQMPSGPDSFREFELKYPIGTRELILAHPGKMVVGSDQQFYSRLLINIDWPANNGREILLRASREFPNW